MITGVGRARHNGVGALSDDVLAWRATGDIVIPREVRVRIAIRVGNRPSGNVRRQAPTKWETQGECYGRISVTEAVPCNGAPSGAA